MIKLLSKNVKTILMSYKTWFSLTQAQINLMFNKLQYMNWNVSKKTNPNSSTSTLERSKSRLKLKRGTHFFDIFLIYGKNLSNDC
jgi:hypothetical protein